APGDDRGAGHHGQLGDHDHDRHEQELLLDRGDQLTQQREGALARGAVLLLAVGLVLRIVLVVALGLHCGGAHRPSSWIGRSSSSPVRVSMSWTRRRSSSWLAITQR